MHEFDAGRTRSEPAAGAGRLPNVFQAAFGPDAVLEPGLALLCLRTDRPDAPSGSPLRGAALTAARELLEAWRGENRWYVVRDVELWWAVVAASTHREAVALAHALVQAGRKARFEFDGKRRKLVVTCALTYSRNGSQPTIEGCFSLIRNSLRSSSPGSFCLAASAELHRPFSVERPVASVQTPQPATEQEPSLQGRAGDESGATRDDILERRLNKVVSALEAAEAEIARLRSQVSGDAHALPSAFREVQGLPPDEEGRKLKRKLLKGVFRANLEQREQPADDEPDE